jgi:hypothetical protein
MATKKDTTEEINRLWDAVMETRKDLLATMNWLDSVISKDSWAKEELRPAIEALEKSQQKLEDLRPTRSAAKRPAQKRRERGG